MNLYEFDCIDEIDSVNFEIWYRHEISVNEFLMLHAWYTIKAIEKVKEVYGDEKAIQIKKDFKEVYSWEKTISKFSMLDIENHLRKVCDYHNKKYNIPYKWEWLLYFDEELYERLINDMDYFKKRQIRSKEIKATAEEITKI